ncbi:MAG TPA: hypothetical protein VJB15_06045 [Rhodothermia bacterium]|nr:hypothetical protein [Rhodothermia bacterium]
MLRNAKPTNVESVMRLAEGEFARCATAVEIRSVIRAKMAAGRKNGFIIVDVGKRIALVNLDRWYDPGVEMV